MRLRFVPDVFFVSVENAGWLELFLGGPVCLDSVYLGLVALFVFACKVFAKSLKIKAGCRSRRKVLSKTNLLISWKPGSL